MTTTELYIHQYTDIAFWLGSTVGAMFDPILWVVVVAANVKKHTALAIVAVALLWGFASTWFGVQADTTSGLNTTLNWLHLPTRILAGLIIGFSSMQIIKFRNSRKSRITEAT